MRFYGSLNGNGRTEATKGGHKGISGHVRGWAVGVNVEGRIGPEDQDVFTITATTGSGGSGREIEIGTVQLIDDVPCFTPAQGFGRGCAQEIDEPLVTYDDDSKASYR